MQFGHVDWRCTPHVHPTQCAVNLVAATNLTFYNLCMQVAPASTEQKRSFLIKKGLTVGEIDEAFRRAPDAPAAAAVAPAPAAPLATTVSPYAAPSPPGQQQVWLHCALVLLLAAAAVSVQDKQACAQRCACIRARMQLTAKASERATSHGCRRTFPHSSCIHSSSSSSPADHTSRCLCTASSSCHSSRATCSRLLGNSCRSLVHRQATAGRP